MALGCGNGDSEVAGFAAHFRVFHAVQSLYLRSQFRRRYADWQGVSPGVIKLKKESVSFAVYQQLVAFPINAIGKLYMISHYLRQLRQGLFRGAGRTVSPLRPGSVRKRLDLHLLFLENIK